MSKYVQLAKSGTEYAKRMDKLSRRIFGEVVRETNRPSMKVVELLSNKPFYEEDRIINYYPRLKEIHSFMLKLRSYGLYVDEVEDFKEYMKAYRRMKGKGPPPKGQGKRKLKD